MAEIILSPERIEYTGIDAPDYAILLSEDGVKRIRERIESLPESCVAYHGGALALPATRARLRPLGLEGIKREVGSLNLATAAMGAFLAGTGVYPLEAIVRAMESSLSPERAQGGKRALEAGAGLVGG